MRRTLLYVIGDLDVGGAECHLARALPALDRGRYRILVYTLTHRGALAPALEERGVRVVGPPFAEGQGKPFPPALTRALLPLLSGARLLALLWGERPDVVHFFLPAAYVAGGLVSLLAPRGRRVMSRRSLAHYQRAHPWLARVERALHPRMDALLGNSRAVVAELLAEGADPRRLGLLYNGIDAAAAPPESRTETRARLGIREDSLVLVLVANLIPYKGHADLLAALHGVKDSLPEGWVLLAVGRDDGIGGALESRARDLGLSGNVRFLGLRADVPALLAAADLGLSCSHQEGFSNVVLEGMAAGLPMVATDVGGNPEAVVDGETGLLVPPHDPPSLARAILALAGDPEARKRLGAAGRLRVEREFSLARSVAAYEALYAGLLAGRDLPVSALIDAGAGSPACAD